VPQVDVEILGGDHHEEDAADGRSEERELQEVI
jgi:hypothetical protein